MLLALLACLGLASEDVESWALAEILAVSETVDDPGTIDRLREVVRRLDEAGVSSELHVMALYEWGMHARGTGDYATAIAQLERARELQRDPSVGAPPDERLPVYEELAASYLGAGDLDRAEAVLRESLALVRETYGPDAPQMAGPLTALAQAELQRGNAPVALAQRALAICRDRSLEGYIHDTLGQAYLQAGQFGEARRAQEEAVAIRREVDGEGSPQHAYSLLNLATLLSDLGDKAGALPATRQACAIWEQQLGPEHPNVATCLSNLGVLHRGLGQLDEAASVTERSLALRLAVHPPGHPEIGWGQLQLGRVHHAAGRYDEARVLLLDGRAHFGETLDMAAWTARLLGDLELDAGEVDAAERWYRAAIDDYRRWSGLDHPEASDAVLGLARVHVARGEPEAARAAIGEALDVQGATIDDILSVTSERERLAMVQSRRRFLDAWLSVVEGEQAWQAVLDWKGLVGEAIRREREAGPPEVRRELATVREELARLELLALVEGDPGHADAIARLTARKEALEREIATFVTPDDRRAHAPPQEVCQALPPRSALVDLLRFDRIVATERGVRSQPAYVAFVVGRDCRVTWVLLEEGAAVDAAIERHRALISSDPVGVRARRAAEQVTERLWRPIEAVLPPGSETVIVVPDAAVTGVSFAGLPDGDGFLVERYAFGYGGGARDLVRYAGPRPRRGEGALVVGGVDYGPPRASTTSGCVSLAFEPLPGARAEAEQVAARLGRAEILTAREATVEAVRERVEGRRIVHLATHGFIAGDACGTDPASLYNPLVRSAIALSGANELAPGREDGVWTAEEVAVAPLADTDLLVLSACETGLGEVRSGEGVLGLRRAVVQAGAGTLLMALWAVPDTATRELMDGFYARLGRGRRMGVVRALRDAQLAMLAAQRDALGHGDPVAWGAFVAAGDPR